MTGRIAEPDMSLNSSHINTVRQQANGIVRQHSRTRGVDVDNISGVDLTIYLTGILVEQSHVVVDGIETPLNDEVVQAKRLIWATIFLMRGQTIDYDTIPTYATRLVASLPPPTTT